MKTHERGLFERRIRTLSRVGVGVSFAFLSAGLVLSWFGEPRAGVVLLAGIAALIAMPVLNVLTALVEEVQRREWTFAAAALAVLLLLLFNALGAR